MATMTLSIPDEIEQRFSRVFADTDPSIIVARLMAEAIAQEERRHQSNEAVRRVLARRRSAPPTALSEILDIRDAVRAESDAGNESGRL